MEGECWVTSKEKFHCVYVTKDNVEEFVDLFGCSEEHTFEYMNNIPMVVVHYPRMKWCIHLDSYYVDDFEGWNHYPKEQFDLCYRL